MIGRHGALTVAVLAPAAHRHHPSLRTRRGAEPGAGPPRGQRRHVPLRLHELADLRPSTRLVADRPACQRPSMWNVRRRGEAQKSVALHARLLRLPQGGDAAVPDAPRESGRAGRSSTAVKTGGDFVCRADTAAVPGVRRLSCDGHVQKPAF